MYYGRCLVKVPRTHKFGSVGTPWWKRWATLRWDDDRLKTDRIITAIDDVSFFAELRAELESFGPADRQVLLYLHGYNVSFENAAIRAAQIGLDLKVKGLTAFFSWPSCASISKYFADAERIGASEQDITAFLLRLAENTAPKDVHIIAHSMGNRGLARAIQRIVGEASKHSGLRFGHIILAAPDIEVTLFRDLARVYPLLCRRTTMYVSARDKALGMAKWLQDAERAGYTPPVTVVPDIDTVEVTEVDLTLLGHGYYAEANGVLRDIYELINFNATPDARARTRPSSSTPKYWIIGR